MPRVTYSLDRVDQTLGPHSPIVTANHLGSIYTTFLTLENYSSSISSINVGGIRWPGGMVAEAQTDKYSLTFPDVFNTDLRPDRGLTEVLRYANANGLSFAMVLPTDRYMDDTTSGVAHVAQFVRRLLNGDFGEIPEDFILEIGNETSHYGWSNGRFTPGIGSYGHIANEFLTAINRVLCESVANPNSVRIQVAVQMSTTVGGQASILSQITPENLRTVDGFIRHSGLVMNAEDFNVNFENAKVAALSNWWSQAWGGRAPDLRILDTAWAVGPSDPIPTKSSTGDYDIGTRHAAAVVETFSKLMATGSDYAAIWGVQNNPSSMFYHEGEKITYGGHAFRLIAESLVGTTLIDGKLDAAGNWVKSGANWDSVAYADGAKAVIFVSAGEISPAGLDVTIDLQGLGGIQYAWAEVISSQSPTRAGQIVVTPIGSPGGPVVSRHVVAGNGNTITVRLAQDFEVIRIIAAREVPMDGHLHLWGTDAADSFTGGNSGDLLEGNMGNDTLNGGCGIDTLLGGVGNDTYIVDATNDMVFETTTTSSGLDTGGVDTVMAFASFSLDSHASVRFVENLMLIGAAHLDGTGNALTNRIEGNAGNNSLNGGAGNDILVGAEGDDILFGGDGDDRMRGGSGDDTYVVNSIGDQVFETTWMTGGADAGGLDTVQSTISFNLVGAFGLQFVENLILLGNGNTNATGNVLSNKITGTPGNNLLSGAGGDDHLGGWGGNDSLFGGAGNDTLFGGGGDDWMLGGEGDDVYIVDAEGDQVRETTASGGTIDAGGTDTVQCAVSFSLDTSDGTRFVENLALTGIGNINATGNALSNTLTGNAGANWLSGGAGSDLMTGWGGNDVLNGGSGNDAVFGNAGNDNLSGETGADTLTGGAGSDVFIFTSCDAIDLIVDFDVAEDLLYLQGERFGGLADGALAAGLFAANPLGAATTAAHRIIYETDTGRLSYDSDGTGEAAAVHFAAVSAGLGMTNVDVFIF